MKKIIAFSALTMALGAQAQDVHFSQVYNNPLHVNPANVGGFTGYERIILNYRNQWSSADSPFNTMGFSFDMPMFQRDGKKAHLGLGLSVYNDRAGDSKFGTTYPALSIGGIVPLNKDSKLTTAVQLGYLMKSANLSSLTWGSQFDGKEVDPTMPTGERTSSVSDGAFDVGAGIRYELDVKREAFSGFTFTKFDIGFAAYHVTQPQMSFLSGGNITYMKYVGHFSGRFDLDKVNIGILPYAAVFFQGPYKEINGGMMVRWKLSEGTKITGFLTETALYMGAHYRADDAIVPQVMFEYGSWGIGVSYDLTTSNFKQINNMNGGFEISLKWHDLKGAIFKKRVNATIY